MSPGEDPEFTRTYREKKTRDRETVGQMFLHQGGQGGF